MTICPKFLYSGPDVPWMNPQCLGINTLPPRSNLYTYPSEKKALNAEPLDSPWHLLLDGQWSFKLYRKPSDLEQGIIDPDYKDSGWVFIKVPGNWMMQGLSLIHI